MPGPDGANHPLDGITVVDLTQVIAGPFATMVLGDMGADVIKVEATGRGDLARLWRPRPEYFDTLNRNKRSVAVDLTTEEGQSVVHSLLADADVLVENMKPGRMEKFGLDYETVGDRNPDLVYCSISGFGEDSPYADLPAWDIIVQAMSGVMSITGEADGEPVWCGLPIGDITAGHYAVHSVLGALYARDVGGESGDRIEVPMMDSLVSLLTARAGHTFGTGEPFPRAGTRHPTICPFGVYDTSDGKIVVAAGTDGLWPSFCAALDRPDLLEDDRFDSQDTRLDNREALMEEIEPELAARTTDDWIETLHDAEVPATRINDTKTVWDDPHVKHRNLHRRMPRDGRADADVIAPPVRSRNRDELMELPPPDLGEHTDEVLRGCGLGAAEIEALRESGTVE